MSEVPRDRGLAVERTVLAWQRSGLSFAVVGGLSLRAGLVGPSYAAWLGVAMSAVLVVAGIATSAYGSRIYRTAEPASAHRRVLRALSAITVVAAVGALVLAGAALDPGR